MITADDDLTTDQRRVWDAVTSGRRGPAVDLVGESGGLIGPFNALVTSPLVGGHLAALGTTLRFDTTLDRNVIELAIIVVGAHWHANFEFWAHSRMARQFGVPAEVVAAVQDERQPDFGDDATSADAYRFVQQLLADGHVDEVTYGTVGAAVGDPGLVELVALVGYYTLICFMLNAFDIGLPPGQVPAWPPA
jgi:4-carboxymuconolactone decarboxylase